MDFMIFIWYSFICLEISYVFIYDSRIFLHVFGKTLPLRPVHSSRSALQLGLSQCHLNLLRAWQKTSTEISAEISTDVNMIYCLERFFFFYLVSSCIKFRKIFAIWNGKTKTQVATSSTAKSCACFAKACTRIGAQTLKQDCRILQIWKT